MSYLNQTLIFQTNFETSNIIFMKIHPVGAELFHEDMQDEAQSLSAILQLPEKNYIT
jgi:hypothetical protein